VPSLEGIPGMSQATRDFVQVVRLYTRDFPELNRLVAGEESDDRQIAWAIMDALSDFNGTPPITVCSLEYLFSRQQHALVLRMTVCALLESVGLLQTRNHINYSNGGITVGVNDKTQLIQSWLQYYKASSDQMKQRVKVAFNIESILGEHGMHSEYWSINATYAAY
jgi:hypothetical protein